MEVDYKATDKDIIQSLETLLNVLKSTGYQRIDITIGDLEDILDLINRQNTEITTLKANLEWCRGTGIRPM